MQPQLERTLSIRAVDDTGNYYDVDHFIEYLIGSTQASGELRPIRSVRVNRQAAKQLDDSTYEVIATGLRLRRVSPAVQSVG